MTKTEQAIARLEQAAQWAANRRQKLTICYSGGKDSDVLLHLALRANIPPEARLQIVHNHTTVDAPETVYHIRAVKKRLVEQGITLEIRKPPITMWELIAKKRMPPTQLARYCCAVLKEGRNAPDEMAVTGVRWDESQKRKSRSEIESIEKRKANKLTANFGDREDADAAQQVLDFVRDPDEQRKAVEPVCNVEKSS